MSEFSAVFTFNERDGGKCQLPVRRSSINRPQIVRLLTRETCLRYNCARHEGNWYNDMAVTHTEADATAATAMTNAVADIEQETPEIGKERQLAGVGTGAGAGTNNNKKPHDHALASILGPAFVAAVAYVDPGNVAANITSGARYGYLLVWVLVLANAMSVLIQYQSAKLGIVTNNPCRNCWVSV